MPEDTFLPSLEKSQVVTLHQCQSSLLLPEHRIRLPLAAVVAIAAAAATDPTEETHPPLGTPRSVAAEAGVHVASLVQAATTVDVAAERAATSPTTTGRALVVRVKGTKVAEVEPPDPGPQTKGSPVFPEPPKAEEREAQPEQELSPTSQGVLSNKAKVVRLREAPPTDAPTGRAQ